MAWRECAPAGRVSHHDRPVRPTGADDVITTDLDAAIEIPSPAPAAGTLVHVGSDEQMERAMATLEGAIAANAPRA